MQSKIQNWMEVNFQEPFFKAEMESYKLSKYETKASFVAVLAILILVLNAVI